MKKTIFTVLSIMAIMVSAPAMAQNEPNSNSVVTEEAHSDDEDERKPVKSADLPKPVQDELGGANYEGWEVSETCYWVKSTDARAEHYEVTLKNTSTGESKLVRFDAQGKVIS